MSDQTCSCSHKWSEHDLYGCQYQDGCRQIDRDHVFDPEARRAVTVDDFAAAEALAAAILSRRAREGGS